MSYVTTAASDDRQRYRCARLETFDVVAGNFKKRAYEAAITETFVREAPVRSRRGTYERRHSGRRF